MINSDEQKNNRVIAVGSGFWNLRGSFKVGPIDIGTHASLIQLSSGDFVLLDSYSFDEGQQRLINDLTNDGARLSAVINLHPFHTVHCREMFERFPHATHYGTRRHHDKFPDLNWDAVLSEDLESENLFADDLSFSVPQGVDFISENESIHFSSILALHQRSNTLHVDDTLMVVKTPSSAAALLEKISLKDPLQFHPTLPLALEKRQGAVDDFQDWVDTLAQLCANLEHICAAHNGVISQDANSLNFSQRIKNARRLALPVLLAHRLRYG